MKATLAWPILGILCALCELPAMALAQPPTPISRWSGEGNANDSIGSNHGTLVNGVSFEPGVVGQALRFDGIDDFVEAPDDPSLDLTTSITIEAWVKRTTSGKSVIVAIKRLLSNNSGYSLSVSTDGTLNASVFNRFDHVTGPVIALNVFTHVAWTYDTVAGRSKLYMNGQVKSTLVNSSLIGTNDQPLYIGGHAASFCCGIVYGAGVIDEVAVYGQALSDQDIQAIYSAICHDTDADGFTNCAGDCDDGNPQVYPGAPEICDKVDNDCNGTDERIDGVGDPWKDTDGDGLYDCWEVYGIDGNVTMPGIPAAEDVDLALHEAPYNADRKTRDLFVEVDWMVGVDHSHEPFQEALDRVANSFWANSVTSTGERRPIRIHWVIDEEIQETPSIEDINRAGFNLIQYGVIDDYPDPTVVCNAANEGHFGTTIDRDASSCSATIQAKSYVIRYLLMVHDIQSGFSGGSRPTATGECSSTGLAVAQGSQNFVVNVLEFFGGLFLQEIYDKQAGTLMHELGHTLGLKHGGATDSQCKPNYLSVMNYSRMHRYSGLAKWIPGIEDGSRVRVERYLDYSSEELPALNESTLFESNGISSSVNTLTLYGVNGVARAGPASAMDPATGAIDWNDNNILEDPVSGTLDINAINTVPSCNGGNDPDPNGMPTQFLNGHHDWYTVLSCMRLPNVPVQGMARFSPLSTLVLDPNEFAQEPTEADYLNGSLGSLDADSDGVVNTLDLCPLDADPNQENSDGDVRGDVCDCLLLDPSAWAKPPSETRNLSFLDNQTVAWTGVPDFFGATRVQYDTVRSSDSSDFTSSITCVESGDGTDMQAMDSMSPSPGQIFYYLVRARNLCPNSEGTLGLSSNGVERAGAPCL